MIKNYESVEERIRNSVGVFNSHIQFVELLKDCKNNPVRFNKILNIILSNNDNMKKSIDYLIQVGHVVDQYLPKDFSINEVIDKSQIYK